MNEMRPPSLATWLLAHTPGPRNEALAGDLLEERLPTGAEEAGRAV